jgi:hypothetical protein
MSVFKWLGWFFVIGGIAFIVGAITITGPGVTFSILGGIFVLMGLLFIALAWGAKLEEQKKQEVLATGLAGTATITAVEPTGTEINDEPRCRITVNVSLPDRLTYQATVTEVIPRIALARYAPGAVFPCRVKPDDLAVVYLIDDYGVERGSSAATLASGIAGQATVLAVFTPPPTDLAEPLWGLKLRIAVDDGRPPYEVRLATVYPAGREQPGRGTQLPVKIDPEEPRRVAVDWSATAV